MRDLYLTSAMELHKFFTLLAGYCTPRLLIRTTTLRSYQSSFFETKLHWHQNVLIKAGGRVAFLGLAAALPPLLDDDGAVLPAHAVVRLVPDVGGARRLAGVPPDGVGLARR